MCVCVCVCVCVGQLEMGGLDSSFLVREGGVEVFRNRDDGVAATGLRISLGHKGQSSCGPPRCIARLSRLLCTRADY